MTLVEGGVGLDETDRRPHRRPDAAPLDDHVVLQPAHEPEAGRFLKDDQPQAIVRAAFRGNSITVGNGVSRCVSDQRMVCSTPKSEQLP